MAGNGEAESTTRTEHIQWAKDRALEYLDTAGVAGTANAFASIASDLRKHCETENHPGIELGMGMTMMGKLATPEEMRKFIEGFN